MADRRNDAGIHRLAVITARGGSKRIPKKNIREFCGKPIIAYPIQAALDSGLFDEVMVSTDDETIKEIAVNYGAKVPFMRSKEASSDFATTADVITEVLDSYKKLGKEFDQVCCLYPMVPFVTAKKLQEAMEKLQDANSVMPVVKFSFPPLRSVVIKDGMISPMWKKYMSCRSQDLPELYHDCGQFYCFWVKEFQKQKKLIMKKTVPVIMDELEVQDIDNEDDWELAEEKYQLLQS